jgi:Photosynthetic reaction centre cytochrome C subunit
MPFMRTTPTRASLVLVVASSIAGAVAAAQAPSQPPGFSPAPAASPATAPAPAASPSGSPPPYAAENEKYIAAVTAAIKGKEELPAKEVFKNVQLLGDVPAARLLRTMQGFTRSIGVACTKCHVADHWDSDDKEEKGVTRDMVKMTRAINEDYLKKIQALAEDKPNVNCFTCHRGQAHPGAELRPPTTPAR